VRSRMRERVEVLEGGIECNCWAWRCAGGLKEARLTAGDAEVGCGACTGAAGMRMKGEPAIVCSAWRRGRRRGGVIERARDAYKTRRPGTATHPHPSPRPLPIPLWVTIGHSRTIHRTHPPSNHTHAHAHVHSSSSLLPSDNSFSCPTRLSLPASPSIRQSPGHTCTVPLLHSCATAPVRFPPITSHVHP
jgi:hypothetical protein